MKSLRTRLAVALAMVAHVSCLRTAPSTCSKSDPATNPLASSSLATDQRFTFEGMIEERIDTGNYRYLRVSGRWVVSLAMTSPSEGRVRVTAIGRATDFASKRLGRRFDVLVFGIVRAATAAAEGELQ
jgi:hypothetical protein